MAPRVTIGIPSYNNAETIVRALRSIRLQSFADWQVILSDDASSDDTVANAIAEIDGDPRFEIVRQDKRSGTMNFLSPLERAQTPLFVWLAGDDYWYPEFLRRAVETLDDNPDAIGTVSQCLYQRDGRLDGDGPDTSPLTGSWSDRVCRFFERPNGTRMYGVFRRPTLARAFPRRPMEGYDWALMVSALRDGDLLEVPAPLLVRDRTPWQAYSANAVAGARRATQARFPLLDMSLYLLCTGNFPLSRAALFRLYALNCEKEEEALYVSNPLRFLARHAGFKRRGLPLSSNPIHPVKAAQTLLEDPERPDDDKELAMTFLCAMADAGEPLAQRACGRVLAERAENGEAVSVAWAYLRAAARSDSDAALDLIEFERDQGLVTVDELYGRYLRLAEDGSAFAAARAGFLLVRGLGGSVDEWRLHALLDAARRTGATAGLHPLAWITEKGRGCRRNLPQSEFLYERAVRTNPTAHRDLARLAHDNDDRAQAVDHYLKAIDAGMEWSVIDLVRLYRDDWSPDAFPVLHSAVGVLVRTSDATLRWKLNRLLSALDETVWIALLAWQLGYSPDRSVALRDRLLELGACRPTDRVGLPVAAALERGA